MQGAQKLGSEVPDYQRRRWTIYETIRIGKNLSLPRGARNSVRSATCIDLLPLNLDGFVKSPSVPLGAGLRCNFVVAAHL